MDYFQGVRAQIRAYLVFVILAENLLLIAGIWYAVVHLELSLGYVALGAYGVSVIMTFIITFAATDFAMEPLRAIWQAVVHISPKEKHMQPPDINKLVVGRVLVTNLIDQIYQIADTAEHADNAVVKQSSRLSANLIANTLPLPLIVINASQAILYANAAAAAYLNADTGSLEGKDIHAVMQLSFPNDNTLDTWLGKVGKSSVTADNFWERVRLDASDTHPEQLFDLAAHYNKGNPDGYETVLVLFDHTKRYSQDDQAMSFIALGVHELRTPLALLRGYIEALDEETHGKLTPELDDFMTKMNATSQQLTAFVNTILSVARVDSDQLVLQLHEENWTDVITGAVNMMSLRAHVRGIALKLQLADKLPSVAADRISVQEVVGNLIDNAIKYSGEAKEIVISAAVNGDGMVETTVRDFGVGIPVTTMPNLFTKYYRDHHNRSQIGGTGLGLYLCKAIISAHGGNIWVKSKEGTGSAFSFTLLPYSRLAEEAKTNVNNEIVRRPHGWIKNHSLYRR